MARFSDERLPIRVLDQHNKAIQSAASKEAAQRFTRNVFAGLKAGFYARTDARARANPTRFHHLYEWGSVGDGDRRLFKLISRNIGTEAFEVSYDYVESTVPVPNSGHVFSQKAKVMEEGNPVTIAPVNASMLSFEVDGQRIYTANEVIVPRPGGEAVKNALREEFMYFFRPSVLTKNPVYQASVDEEKQRVLRRLGKAVK